MAKVTLDLKTYWLKEGTTLAECFACNDVIYGDQYVFTFEINGVCQSSGICLCESCKDLINEVW